MLETYTILDLQLSNIDFQVFHRAEVITDNVVCCCMFFVNLSPDTCGSGFSIRRVGRVSPSQKTQNDAFMQGTMVKAGRSPLNVVVDEVITSCFLRTEEYKGTNSCDSDGSTCTSFVLQYLLVEVTSSRRKLNSQPQMFHQQAIFMDLGPGNPELMLQPYSYNAGSSCRFSCSCESAAKRSPCFSQSRIFLAIGYHARTC